MKKKLIFIFLAILLSLFCYILFNMYKYKEYKAVSNKYLSSGEFEKANKALKIAMRYDLLGISNEDNISIRAIENYLEAKKYFEQKDYLKAQEYINKISEKKIDNLEFSSEIINFRNEIAEKFETNNRYNQIFSEIQALIDAEDFKGANNKYSEFSKLKLDEEQVAKKNELRNIITEGIKRQEEEERDKSERERKEQEESIIRQNKQKEEEALNELNKKEEEEQKKENNKTLISREEAKKIFLDKSKFDTNKYKVIVSTSEDYMFNNDLCYLIRVIDKDDKNFKKEYYINSRTGEFTLAENLK